MLIVLCIYFQGKIKFSHCIWSIYLFRILIFICSAILLSRMKLLFFSLWKFAKLLMLFCKAQVSFPSNFASIFSAIKYHSSLLFLAQTLHTSFKRRPLKCKFLTLLSVRVKNTANCWCQFWNNKSIPLQILYHSSLLWQITLL